MKKVYDQLDEARIASDDASARVRQIEAVMEEKTRASREESSQLTTRMDDLQKQNEILHEQAERVFMCLCVSMLLFGLTDFLFELFLVESTASCSSA